MWDQTRPERPDPRRGPDPRPGTANGVPGSVGRHARPDDTPVFGRAAVPVPPRRRDGGEGAESALRESTAELPVVKIRKPDISWYRPSRASLRSLSDGWGLSATGLLLAFCGWGVWAAAGRGEIAAPLVGFGIVLAVAVGVFALSRLLGRIVLVGLMRRGRPHARWAHLLTGLFLSAAGIAYFGQTSWIIDGWRWVQEQMQRF
jgi:hypothetical protein